MSIPTVDIGRAWRREIRGLLIWQLLWLLVGFMAGYPLVLSFAALAAYLGMQLIQAYRLHRWLVGGARDAPAALGAWQEIFLEFARLKQRNHKRKKQLRNIVKEFQSSTAALPDGAVVLDSRGQIMWFNQAAAALLALRSPQDKGQRIVNLVRHPRFRAYVAHGGQGQHEIQVPSAVREGVVALRVIPYGSGQQLLIARDVSANKRLEATRRDFVANASHELRTPVTVLRGYLEMMAEEACESGSLAQWQAPVDEMERQTARMSWVIESLLKLARVEAEGYQQPQELVDVPELIERVAVDGQQAADRSERIDTQLDAGLLLFGRRGELESVVSNLVGNAIRYTPADAGITLYWWQDEEGVYFSVSDLGPGIAAHHIERLTERFYRVDAGRESKAGGTGLGLAIVKHCLEHHDADLMIRSEPGAGSTFTCRFPRHRARIREAE